MQERVMSLELEWAEVLDKIMAREDRERKRRIKALRDEHGPDNGQLSLPEASGKDDLRKRLGALRGIK